MNVISSDRASERGTAAIEMALVLPLLVLILGGIIDFGFAFNAQVSLTHAAREGVRVEAIGSGDGAARALAAYTAPATTNPSASATSCGGSGGDAQVIIRADYSYFILPFDDRSFQGQAVMRCGG